MGADNRTKMQKEDRKWAFDLSKDKYQTRREVSLSTSSSTSSSGQITAPLGYRSDVQVSSEAGSRTGAGKGNAPATPNMKELLKKKAWEASPSTPLRTRSRRSCPCDPSLRASQSWAASCCCPSSSSLRSISSLSAWAPTRPIPGLAADRCRLGDGPQ